MEEVKKGKRGRKKIQRENAGTEEGKQCKFFVDLSNESEVLDSIFLTLEQANNKLHGRKITFKDLAIYSVPKLSGKDLEKIQEASLTDMERVQKLLDEYNGKNSSNLSMGEFLVKKMNILKEEKKS
jgi:hypothetical protein